MNIRGPVILLACLSLLARADSSGATRNVADYRYFRALSIDLLGRPPTRAELTAFEQPQFSLEQWLDAHLEGPRYGERLRRIYMDLLRLELPTTYRFEPGTISLFPITVAGPTGAVQVYYRVGQRRADPAIDGRVCFTEDEIGVKLVAAGKPTLGTPKQISQKLLDDRTTLVKPWWLYADYKSADPKDRIGPEWAKRFPGFELALAMFDGPDGQPTAAIRVCKEETQVAAHGHVAGPSTASGTRKAPVESEFAKTHRGQLVSCMTSTGYKSSSECGCGVGLERCIPFGPPGFVMPMQTPLGSEEPFVSTPRPAWMWLEAWWSEEASHFLQDVFEHDRDTRTLLTGHSTIINGPLAQFYRFFASASCCGSFGPDMGLTEPESLFEPARVPELAPQKADEWVTVPDRGPHAAGLLTMPIFLTKYGTRRARGHVLYQVFECRDFISPNVKLTPSNEADLTKRPGCSSCHRSLEPRAAYFSRVAESDWTYLPQSTFPTSQPRCAASDPKAMTPACKAYYDPAFTTADHSFLRGAYAAPDHADAGPAALAATMVASPDFAPCVVKQVAQSLLGRTLTADDDAWKDSLAKLFVEHGYRMRPLVRAILTSPDYRAAARDTGGTL
jgi:hypothetical protein